MPILRRYLACGSSLLLLTMTTLSAEVTQTTQTYKTLDDGTELKVDIYQPTGTKAGDKRPGIVFFFGGGWVKGTRTHFAAQSKELAAEGIVCLAPDYRTKGSHGTTPREALMDAKSAMRWAYAHAEELGIDPKRLGAGGGSAGGHLAAATGMSKGFDDPKDDTSVDPTPAAYVLFNPVLDNGPKGYGYERVKDYYQDFSPRYNIRPGLGPMVIFLGTKDKLIPAEEMEAFAAEMKAKGNRCDLFLYEGQGHGFFNRKANNTVYYEKTLAEARRFLQSLGWLPAN